MRGEAGELYAVKPPKQVFVLALTYRKIRILVLEKLVFENRALVFSNTEH